MEMAEYERRHVADYVEVAPGDVIDARLPEILEAIVVQLRRTRVSSGPQTLDPPSSDPRIRQLEGCSLPRPKSRGAVAKVGHPWW
jgi:hypothetical protein